MTPFTGKNNENRSAAGPQRGPSKNCLISCNLIKGKRYNPIGYQHKNLDEMSKFSRKI